MTENGDRLIKKIQILEIFGKRLKEYEAIGTVEECREARERQMQKNPVKDEYNHDCCSNCG